MTNLAIELLLLIVVLINFGATLTAKFIHNQQNKFNVRDYFVLNLLVTHIVFFNKLIPK